MKGRVNELKQIKSKFGRFGRILSGFLAAVLFISGVPTTAFAWGTEGQVCSSKYGDRYVGADGQYYYAASVVDFIAYDDNGNVSVHSNASGNARRKYLLVEADGTERSFIQASSSVPMSVSVPVTSLYGMVYRWERYRMDAASSPSGPPNWLMMTWAILGLVRVIFTGYCSLFS